MRIVRRLATAFIGDFLAIGQPANVRASIDAAGGAARSARRAFRKAAGRSAGPRTASLYGYAPRRGRAPLLRADRARRRGSARLLDDPGLAAAVAARAARRTASRSHYAEVLSPPAAGRASRPPFRHAADEVGRGHDRLSRRAGRRPLRRSRGHRLAGGRHAGARCSASLRLARLRRRAAR